MLEGPSGSRNVPAIRAGACRNIVLGARQLAAYQPGYSQGAEEVTLAEMVQPLKPQSVRVAPRSRCAVPARQLTALVPLLMSGLY